MKIRAMLVCALYLSQAACATPPTKIEGTYTSPQNYASWTCEQLLQERITVTTKAREIGNKQQSSAESDQVFMTVGLLITWPALIGLAFTKDHAHEFADLKGKYEAIAATQDEKSCELPDSVKTPFYEPPKQEKPAMVPGHDRLGGKK